MGGGVGEAQGSLLCSSVSRSHTHTHTVKNKHSCTQTFSETKTEKYAVKFEDRTGVSAGGQGYPSLDVLFLHVH